MVTSNEAKLGALAMLLVFTLLFSWIFVEYRGNVRKHDRFKAEVNVCLEADDPEDCVRRVEILRQCDTMWAEESLRCLAIERGVNVVPVAVDER